MKNITVSEHTLTVALNRADPQDPRRVEIFARVLSRDPHLPYLLYLQGGPGCEAPRLWPAWAPVALERYQVVLLDQRGTGRSAPVGSPQDADYLRHLRADAIVADAEDLREHLGVRTWSVLGQSFGGFSALRYLSAHPESIERAFFTGGLPSLTHSPEEIYAATYSSMRQHTEDYYRRFPEHRARMAELMERAAQGELVLPDAEVVTPSRLRSVGHLLGTNDGWIQLHGLLDLPWDSPAFAHDLAAALPFNGRNPLYFVLHESCYANGATTDWAAHRALPRDYREDPTLLTGEHVHPEWLDTVPAFRPWRNIAKEIAATPWPRLYDPEAIREARGAAAIYAYDAYVPLEFSLDTARHMPALRTLVTSEHEHNGLRASGGEILRHLFDLSEGARLR
ncbi:MULTISPECIES: alpha/beta fold hydrolase [unclassified Corynebacterium]|uniref:alpha/beta fold hydrolase n=1 Tax=unclassified Corynebacterium TaxID=2624378 RepID=UPI0029CAAAD8|nr:MULTISPECIES: alpha/beta fold hydrolase [unclassified Corynebacterium]WPF67071.1 alpha/beta fold hydrolase [Corynebacterium sp. 22KM0430]WPF69559.1 alpha/beta fold hydrolase [Corynebacterium sp. 21KM1197]